MGSNLARVTKFDTSSWTPQLKVKVERGSGLPDTRHIRTPKFCVAVTIGEQTRETGIGDYRGKSQPIWDQVLAFTMPDDQELHDQRIRFEVFDKRKRRGNLPVGTVQLSIQEAREKGGHSLGISSSPEAFLHFKIL